MLMQVALWWSACTVLQVVSVWHGRYTEAGRAKGESRSSLLNGLCILHNRRQGQERYHPPPLVPQYYNKKKFSQKYFLAPKINNRTAVQRWRRKRRQQHLLVGWVLVGQDRWISAIGLFVWLSFFFFFFFFFHLLVVLCCAAPVLPQYSLVILLPRFRDHLFHGNRVSSSDRFSFSSFSSTMALSSSLRPYTVLLLYCTVYTSPQRVFPFHRTSGIFFLKKTNYNKKIVHSFQIMILLQKGYFCQLFLFLYGVFKFVKKPLKFH